MSFASRPLHEGWTFTQVGEAARDVVKEGEWIPVQSFPTTVHVELLKAGRIPDPVSGAAHHPSSYEMAHTAGSLSDCRRGMCNVRSALSVSSMRMIVDGLVRSRDWRGALGFQNQVCCQSLRGVGPQCRPGLRRVGYLCHSDPREYRISPSAMSITERESGVERSHHIGVSRKLSTPAQKI